MPDPSVMVHAIAEHNDDRVVFACGYVITAPSGWHVHQGEACQPRPMCPTCIERVTTAATFAAGG